MRDKKEFYGILSAIDGAEYAEYTKLIGDFDFARYVLKINQVQESPQDGPTLLVVRVPQIIAGFPPHLFNTPVRRTALEDFLLRRIAERVEELQDFDEEGLARRRLSVAAPGQKILPRSSLVVAEEYLEARLYLDMPVSGGRIPGDTIKEVFFEDLPGIVNSSLIYCNVDEREVEDAVDVMEDADEIRQLLGTRGLVGFVGEGSLLSRYDGEDEPDYERAVPLKVDESARLSLEVPHAGSVEGVGIPTGITVVLGSDYSGRIEFMRALAAGIYNHVPGDGREMCIAVPDVVYIASEPGRSIQRVDISAFVPDPRDGDGREYSTTRADACISEAAATVEAIEVGARVLMYDESDSSASFLSRDADLAELTPELAEAVVPLSLRARQMVDELGVSIVVGGSRAVREFIPIADTVLAIEGHTVRDITAAAKERVADELVAAPDVEPVKRLADVARWIIPSSIDPSLAQHDAYIEALSGDLLEFGRSLVRLGCTAQLADIFQTATIGLIMYYAKLRYLEEGRPLREVLDLIDRDLSTEGIECLTRTLRGDLARPRRYEIAAAINRLETLRMGHLLRSDAQA